MELRKIDLTMFPDMTEYRDCAMLPGKLFVGDNLNTADDELQTISSDETPIQLGMGVTFICVEGEMRIEINSVEYKLHSNMGAHLQVNSFVRVTSFSKKLRLIVLMVSPTFIEFRGDVRMGMAAHNFMTENPVYELNPENLPDTINLITYLKKCLRNPKFRFKEEVAKNVLYLLGFNGMQAFIEKHYDQYADTRHRGGRREELFQQFIMAVQENYKKERNVTNYADRLCVTPKYLSTVVYSVSGKYASEWIDEYVIMECKALLLNSSKTIKEICSEMHFANQSFFAKYFKHRTGLSPREFKMQK